MILFRYILKNHLGPFFFSVFTLIAIFLLQFLMRWADKIVGKGLGTWVIIKLIVYNLAWMLVLVVPMSVLVSTLMAFGGMAQNNEIAIMKASGTSLYKIIVPPIFASILIALMLVYFNNNIYPDANHAAAKMIQDINRTKPTLALVPGVFSQEVDNYSILARNITGDSLENIAIYDNSHPSSAKVVTAQKGKLYFSGDQTKLILDLKDGEIHDFNRIDNSRYRILKFKRHKIAMNAEDFAFKQSGPGGLRSDRELGAPALMKIVDSLKIIEKRYKGELASSFNHYFLNPLMPNTYGRYLSANPADIIYQRLKDKINSAEGTIKSRISSITFVEEDINRYRVEVHKKYALPVACIVFVLIGAPLGTMTRRGGFGMAAGLSLIFFLIYWVFLIGGEKMADRRLLSPFVGVWCANFIMGAFGVFVLIKSAKEKIELNFDWMKKLVPKQLRFFTEQNENN